MGIFNRKKDTPSEPPSTIDATTGIDFASYQLDTLGADVRSIVDIPGALAQTAKYALTLPFIVAIITWAVFNARMAGWVLVPFTLVTYGLSLFAAAILGGFFVVRKRLDTVSDASRQVVDVIGEIHSDIARVKDGHANTSVQKVAIGILENAIFPAVFGTLSATAETALGPLGRFSSGITKAPINMVKTSVVSAIEALPDREIGATIDQVGAALPIAKEDIEKISAEYGKVRDKIEGIVAKVSRTALGSVLGFTAVGAIPLLVWLAIGWIAS